MIKYLFSLTKEQEEKLYVWLAERYAEQIEEQRKTMSSSDFKNLTGNGKYPYTGAIGGGVTYCFTPTSLGVITVAKYFDKKIDLTEYEMW